jgi:transposase
MYIEKIPNRNSPPAILLRESFRDGKKVRKRTIANISNWPAEKIEAMRAVLRGKPTIGLSLEEAFDIVRTRPHGHVLAVLGTLRHLKLESLICSDPCRERDLVVAMVVGRIIDPRSKLATARGLGEETLFSTLAEVLGVDHADEDDLYAAMDWLLPQQPKVEVALAKRHLSEGALVLYDVTSSYFEGRNCPLARLGHPRGGKKGKLQIVFGLVCNAEGCPVAIEVFEGNRGDPTTLGSQIEKVRHRFGLQRVVFVGDRGMITEARIRQELRPQQIDWISALRAPAIRQLLRSGSLQLSLFDERYLAEIRDPQYPGERLIACRNPLLAEERARKRGELVEATERELEAIAQATRRKRNRLRGKDKIGMRVGKVVGRYKVAKHFTIEITDNELRYRRDEESIAAEAILDGIYVVRTSVSETDLDSEQTVGAYKGLSAIERAFRSIKTVDLKVRPIFHRLPDRVRAHVFLCMLAYYVEWHMRRALAPMLFDDDDKETAAKQRPSIVAPARRSRRAEFKAETKRSPDDGMAIHSFQTLIEDLATVAKNRIRPNMAGVPEFDRITIPTPLQQRAFDLLGVRLHL